MAFSPARTLLLSLFAAGAAGQALAMPSDGPAIAGAETKAGRAEIHPYSAALGALGNYQSCLVHARPARVAALEAELRAGVAAARAKGLGETLDGLDRAYQIRMRIVDLTACFGGPARALTAARRAVADFRRWVDAQPAG